MTASGIPIQDIDAYIEKSLKDWGVPGGAVAVMRDDELLLSIQRGHGDLVAQCRLGDIDRQLKDDVVVLAGKERVRLDRDKDVQVARRPSERP